MRTFRGLAALTLVSSMVFTSVASAQPGAGAPPPPPPPVYAPPPPPPPQPGYGGYPQYGYPPAGLSAEDQRLLQRGIISPEAHVGGALLALFLGFGSGQAVQGRWTDIGWVFTVGEAAAIAAIIIGVENEAECYDGYCRDNDNGGLIAIGVIGFIGLHVWEIVDSIAGPAGHNRKVRDLHMRMGYPQPNYYGVAPFVAPTKDGGGVAGFTVRF